METAVNFSIYQEMPCKTQILQIHIASNPTSSIFWAAKVQSYIVCENMVKSEYSIQLCPSEYSDQSAADSDQEWCPIDFVPESTAE